MNVVLAITILAVPKPFHDHIGTNDPAQRAWLRTAALPPSRGKCSSCKGSEHECYFGKRTNYYIRIITINVLNK
jgi:hypothetical protein